MRWARAVQAAGKPSAELEPRLRDAWRIIWRELIRPSRHAWTGMAALWVVLLAVNGRLSDHPTADASARATSTQDVMQSWQEQNRVLTELTQPAFTVPAGPALLPRPRSERELNCKTA
jgi:hypothetical protein